MLCFVASDGNVDKDNAELVYGNITTQPANSSNLHMALIDIPGLKLSTTFLNSQYGISLANSLTQNVYDLLKAPPNSRFSKTAPSSALLARY